METYILRLKPGMHLKEEIQRFVNENKIGAGYIVSCAGSLTEYSIRFANQPVASTGTCHFEIVGLSGTLSIDGSHLHISVADSTGKVIGGHLSENNRIYNTAEIVIQSTSKYILKREKDEETGWQELKVITAE